MASDKPARPERIVEAPLPELPDVQGKNADEASVTYSHYRTGLSHHRTELSEHRTDLSEYRSDLSHYRTGLSEKRTAMSTQRTGMSTRRTDLSIQRTRMSADRTLMSEIRTSLSMISFGFTIYQAFKNLTEAGRIASPSAARNFGAALIVLGIIVILGGIWRHVSFAEELRKRRAQIEAETGDTDAIAYPVSISLVVAVLLVLVGFGAIGSVIFNW